MEKTANQDCGERMVLPGQQDLEGSRDSKARLVTLASPDPRVTLDPQVHPDHQADLDMMVTPVHRGPWEDPDPLVTLAPTDQPDPQAPLGQLEWAHRETRARQERGV